MRSRSESVGRRGEHRPDTPGHWRGGGRRERRREAGGAAEAQRGAWAWVGPGGAGAHGRGGECRQEVGKRGLGDAVGRKRDRGKRRVRNLTQADIASHIPVTVFPAHSSDRWEMKANLAQLEAGFIQPFAGGTAMGGPERNGTKFESGVESGAGQVQRLSLKRWHETFPKTFFRLSCI